MEIQLKIDTCPIVTPAGSGGEEEEVSPEGPTHESEEVRARGSWA